MAKKIKASESVNAVENNATETIVAVETPATTETTKEATTDAVETSAAETPAETATNNALSVEAVKNACKWIKEEQLSLRSIVATIYDNKSVNELQPIAAALGMFTEEKSRRDSINAARDMLINCLPVVSVKKYGEGDNEQVKNEPAKLKEITAGVYKAVAETNVWSMLESALNNINRDKTSVVVELGKYYDVNGLPIDNTTGAEAEKTAKTERKEKKEANARKTLGISEDAQIVTDMTAKDILFAALSRVQNEAAREKILEAISML